MPVSLQYDTFLWTGEEIEDKKYIIFSCIQNCQSMLFKLTKKILKIIIFMEFNYLN